MTSSALISGIGLHHRADNSHVLLSSFMSDPKALEDTSLRSLDRLTDGLGFEQEEDSVRHEIQQDEHQGNSPWAADASVDVPLPKAAARQVEASEQALREWIGRIVKQDESALALLYEATLGRIYGLALRITRNTQTAEEVAEDTYWQVWRQAPRFDAARGSVLAWLLTMARSRALDALRGRDRAETIAEPETLIEAEACWQTDPQNLLAALQSDDQLHKALESLDPLPRQLIALAFFRGLTHEEIAAHAELPLGTVKSHIRRALSALRQLLASDSENDALGAS